MRTPTRTFSLFALLLVLAACTGQGRNAPTPQERTTVRVQNQSWLDMNVFVVEGGQRVRLGMVTGNSTATLRIPASVVGLGRSVSFLVDPVGSPQTASSYDIYVSPGESVTITIPPQVR